MTKRLEREEVERDFSELPLHETIGQHLIVDEQVLGEIASYVVEGANVIEIGSGPGNLTRHIAQRAARVIGYEVDRRFDPYLQGVINEQPNITVTFGDALAVNYQRQIESDSKKPWQIVSNLPYHISAPFLEKIAGLQVESVILTIGDNFARLMCLANPASLSYTRSSFVAHTFFHVEQLGELSATAFYPPPRTDSSIVRLVPRSKYEYSDPRLSIFRSLFLNGKQATGHVIATNQTALNSEVNLRSKPERNRHERRQTGQELKSFYGKTGQNSYGRSDPEERQKVSPILSKFSIPQSILSKPFIRLNNDELRAVVAEVNRLFPRALEGYGETAYIDF